MRAGLAPSLCGVPCSVQEEHRPGCFCSASKGREKEKCRPINKSLLPAKPATTGLQGNPVVLLLYRKPQKSEIFGAASQDGGLLLTGGKGLFKGLLLTGGKGRQPTFVAQWKLAGGGEEDNLGRKSFGG